MCKLRNCSFLHISFARTFIIRSQLWGGHTSQLQSGLRNRQNLFQQRRQLQIWMLECLEKQCVCLDPLVVVKVPTSRAEGFYQFDFIISIFTCKGGEWRVWWLWYLWCGEENCLGQFWWLQIKLSICNGKMFPSNYIYLGYRALINNCWKEG